MDKLYVQQDSIYSPGKENASLVPAFSFHAEIIYTTFHQFLLRNIQ